MSVYCLKLTNFKAFDVHACETELECTKGKPELFYQIVLKNFLDYNLCLDLERCLIDEELENEYPCIKDFLECIGELSQNFSDTLSVQITDNQEIKDDLLEHPLNAAPSDNEGITKKMMNWLNKCLGTNDDNLFVILFMLLSILFVMFLCVSSIICAIFL